MMMTMMTRMRMMKALKQNWQLYKGSHHLEERRKVIALYHVIDNVFQLTHNKLTKGKAKIVNLFQILTLEVIFISIRSEQIDCWWYTSIISRACHLIVWSRSDSCNGYYMWIKVFIRSLSCLQVSAMGSPFFLPLQKPISSQNYFNLTITLQPPGVIGILFLYSLSLLNKSLRLQRKQPPTEEILDC